MGEKPKIKLSWDELLADTKALAEVVRDAGLHKNAKGIVALARGGLMTAQCLAYYLNIRRVEALSVIGYDDTVKLAQPKLNGHTSPDLGDGDGWIVVDDLVDTGASFRLIKHILPKARYVAVYAKPEGESAADITVKTFPQDSWLDFPWEVEPLV